MTEEDAGTRRRGDAENRSALAAWLQLLRAPNLFTVPGDVLAGWLLVHGASVVFDQRLAALVGASLCLYAFGLVHNDLADLETDRRERPDRPLPSGRVSRAAAVAAMTLLMVGALGLCYSAGGDAVRTGLFLTASIFIYNQQAKHHAVAGPLVMGLCRGLNLLLGASAVTVFPLAVWICAGLESLYIARVTAMARNEMSGGKVTPKVIGMLISLLLPIQASFCLAAGAGRAGWLCAAGLVAAWPVSRLVARRFHAS